MPDGVSLSISEKLTVLSFNIDGAGSGRSSEHSWAKRAAAVAGALRASRAHIMALQEVRADNLAHLTGVLGHHDWYQGAATGEDTSSAHAVYNTLFWRRDTLECTDAGSFYLSRTPNRRSLGWDSAAVRAATWVHLRLRATGRELLAVNTHLDNRGVVARRESSKLIAARWGRAASRRRIPTILMGDFNARAWAPAAEAQVDYPGPVLPWALPEGGAVHGIYAAYGYKDAYHEAGLTDQLDMNTYHDYYGQRFPDAALRIDWILYRQNEGALGVARYRTLQTKFAGRLPSDHYPVVASFSLEHGLGRRRRRTRQTG